MPIATIHLYGTVEVDLRVVAALNKSEVDEILTREFRHMAEDMRKEFWDNYKPKTSKE